MAVPRLSDVAPTLELINIGSTTQTLVYVNPEGVTDTVELVAGAHATITTKNLASIPNPLAFEFVEPDLNNYALLQALGFPDPAANALTLNGQPLTFNGEILRLTPRTQ